MSLQCGLACPGCSLCHRVITTLHSNKFKLKLKHCAPFRSSLGCLTQDSEPLNLGALIQPKCNGSVPCRASPCAQCLCNFSLSLQMSSNVYNLKVRLFGLHDAASVSRFPCTCQLSLSLHRFAQASCATCELILFMPISCKSEASSSVRSHQLIARNKKT